MHSTRLALKTVFQARPGLLMHILSMSVKAQHGFACRGVLKKKGSSGANRIFLWSALLHGRPSAQK